jgi:hypothetical protein
LHTRVKPREKDCTCTPLRTLRASTTAPKTQRQAGLGTRDQLGIAVRAGIERIVGRKADLEGEEGDEASVLVRRQHRRREHAQRRDRKHIAHVQLPPPRPPEVSCSPGTAMGAEVDCWIAVMARRRHRYRKNDDGSCSRSDSTACDQHCKCLLLADAEEQWPCKSCDCFVLRYTRRAYKACTRQSSPLCSRHQGGKARAGVRTCGGPRYFMTGSTTLEPIIMHAMKHPNTCLDPPQRRDTETQTQQRVRERETERARERERFGQRTERLQQALRMQQQLLSPASRQETERQSRRVPCWRHHTTMSPCTMAVTIQIGTPCYEITKEMPSETMWCAGSAGEGLPGHGGGARREAPSWGST